MPMLDNTTARPGKQHATEAGFTLLELIVVIALVGSLAAVALERLQFYQELAEKAAMEYTVASLRSGLRMQVAEFMVEGRMRQLPTVAGSNPMLLMEAPLPNYREDAPQSPDAANAGNARKARWDGYWFFDTARKELVYQVKRGAHFIAGSDGQKQVRYRVVVYANQVGPGNAVIPSGSRLELVQPYHWLGSE